MNTQEAREVDWKKARSIIEAHLPSLRQASETVEVPEGVETALFDRYGPGFGDERIGAFAELDVWFIPKSMERVRRVVSDEPPFRYENLNENEQGVASRIISNIANLFPDLDFSLGWNQRGLLKYKISPKVLPKKERASEPAPWDKVSRGKLIDERIEQLALRRPNLSVNWDDDHPEIAKELEITTEELRKHLKRRRR